MAQLSGAHQRSRCSWAPVCYTAQLYLVPRPSSVLVSSFPANTDRGLLGSWGAGTRFQRHMLMNRGSLLGSCREHRQITGQLKFICTDAPHTHSPRTKPFCQNWHFISYLNEQLSLVTFLKVRHTFNLLHSTRFGFISTQNVECLGLSPSKFVQINLEVYSSHFLCVCFFCSLGTVHMCMCVLKWVLQNGA